MPNSWLAEAQASVRSRDEFEQNYHDLPGKVRSILKHMDPRTKSSRNIEHELEKFDKIEQQFLKDLLKYHQSLPLNHKYPKPRHKSKYQGKAKNVNHLISRDEMRDFDKRQ